MRQFEIQSGGHVYGVTFDPVHHHHYRPASFRCRRQSYRPARLRGAAGRITRAATAGLALPVLDQRRADPGDLLISLGHARRRIPQINHHNALCFVIRAKQGDNPARTPLAPAPVLSAINQPAGSTERINGPATRSSTIHCSSCRCERALRRWLVSSLRRVAAMLAGVVVSRASPGSASFSSVSQRSRRVTLSPIWRKRQSILRGRRRWPAADWRRCYRSW